MLPSQFIFRNEPGDRYLGSVSNLIQNLFEYAASTQPETPEGSPELDDSRSPITENIDRPYLALATFRMCVLADPLLEDFFESDLTNSWQLEILIPEEKPKPAGAGGWWGGLVSSVLTDENKERFNSLADAVGKKLDIQTIEARPAIGKFDAAAAAIEPTARDSLFSTAPRTPRTGGASPVPGQTSAAEASNPLSAAAMRQPAYPPPPPSDNPWLDSRPAPVRTASGSSAAHRGSGVRDIDVQALARAAIRPQFGIDETGGGVEEGEVDDEQLMNQVEGMLRGQEAEAEGLVGGEEARKGQGEFVPRGGHEGGSWKLT